MPETPTTTRIPFFFRDNLKPEIEAALREVSKLLCLDQEGREGPVTFGSCSSS